MYRLSEFPPSIFPLTSPSAHAGSCCRGGSGSALSPLGPGVSPAGNDLLISSCLATYFSSTGPDPNTPEPDAIDIELNPEQLARAYYRPVVEMLRASSVPPSRRQVDGRADVITPLAGLDARLELEERIFTWYIEGQPNFPTLLADRRSGGSILRDIEALASLPEQDRSSKTWYDEGRWDAIWSAHLRHVRRTGDDGVTVELGPSWDEEYMRCEPEDRAG